VTVKTKINNDIKKTKT